MKRFAAIGVVAGMSFLAWTGTAAAQTDKKDPKASQPPVTAKPTDKQPDKKPAADENAAWEAAAQKNEHHERLKKMEGTWEAAVKMWETPGGTPQESKGVMTAKLINDGLFLQNDYKGMFNNKPFTGSGITGYNNVTKKYESVWTDTMGTGMMMMTGSYDDATKTYTMTGEMDNPAGGKVKEKETIKIVDDNKHVMEFFMVGVPGAGEVKLMEITYTRTGMKPMVDEAKKELKKEGKDAADKAKDKLPKK